MKQVTKRFLSIMLACVMLIGMLPVSAFAADTGSDETPTVPAESQEAVTEVTTTAPEESSSETAAVAPVASEPAEDESDVPEATVPAAAKSAAADPVQQLYDTLMAIHTYEELSDYMDNMTEEEHPQLWILTPACAYRVDLFAGFVTASDSGTYTIFETKEELDAHILDCVASSTFSADYDLASIERIVTLSTCSYEYNTARYVVVGNMVPIDYPA